jgi:hypothetical protein
MSVFQGEGKRKKRRKKGSFNRRDVMCGIINYNVLIFNILQNYKNDKSLTK